MPISSSGRQFHLSGSQNKTRNNNNLNIKQKPPNSAFLKKGTSAATTGTKLSSSHIRHISPPSSLASTSTALRNSVVAPKPVLPLSRDPSPSMQHIAGQLVLTGAEKSPDERYVGAAKLGGATFASKFAPPIASDSSALNAQSLHHLQTSQVSLSQQSTAANSTTHLHHNHHHNHQASTANTFSIRRKVNLKYIKSTIIFLMALDLLITIFVYQFSSQDQMSLWFTSFKMRLSLLNLLLSAVWFIVLVSAILFDVYFILAISCLVNVASFILLFVFSLIHFSRRIDYNTVNLASLLALLFSVIVLHVYLLVLAALTVYLMQAVRRRQKG